MNSQPKPVPRDYCVPSADTLAALKAHRDWLAARRRDRLFRTYTMVQNERKAAREVIESRPMVLL